MSTHSELANRRRAILPRLAARVADSFTYPLRVSQYVQWATPRSSSFPMQARIVGARDETSDARTLILRPGRGWRPHRAGQHVQIGMFIQGRYHARTYTISSPPERNDGCFTITAKTVAGGIVSTHLVRHIQVGDYISVGMPQGDFVLPAAHPAKLLFITAGSGITPAMSMLHSLVAQARLPDTVHIHYAPQAADVINRNDLEYLAREQRLYALQRVFTRAADGGHFSASQLEKLCPDWREREVFACGPPALLAALEAHFAEAGRTANLHMERFMASLSAKPTQAGGGTVRFAKTNVVAAAGSQVPLLRVAEDAGLSPRHGCRMGICHSCDTTLLSGCVRDLRTGELHTEAGISVQPCVSAAAGDCVLEL